MNNQRVIYNEYELSKVSLVFANKYFPKELEEIIWGYVPVPYKKELLNVKCYKHTYRRVITQSPESYDDVLEYGILDSPDSDNESDFTDDSVIMTSLTEQMVFGKSKYQYWHYEKYPYDE